MSNLIKALILALLQLPMFGGAYVLLKQLNQDPVFVAAMAVAYEVVLFAVAFGKKVWATLEPDAVQAVADWIKAVAADARRRFDSSARHYARWVLSEESRVTAFGYDLDLKTKPSVRRIFVNLRLDGAAPSEIIRAPFFTRPALDGDRIWTFLRQAHGSDSSSAALVVLGKAGFGKTTLMQHIGLTFASNRQFRYGMLPHTPLLLYLREHYKTILDKTSPAAAGEPYTLGQLAQEHYALRGVQLSPGWFEQQLDGGKCVVLLDGLDEVPRIEDRQKVSAWIDAQISAYRQSVFVVTSRPEGHEEAPLQNPKCRFWPCCRSRPRNARSSWRSGTWPISSPTTRSSWRAAGRSNKPMRKRAKPWPSCAPAPR